LNDESKDEQRVGRDEMNLAEFPITLLTERAPSGVKTLTLEVKHGTLTISGTDELGLPTAPDADVIVGLIQLTKWCNNFTEPKVQFSRYELLDLLGWKYTGPNYRRLSDSLHRWVSVTLRYDGCWWDNEGKSRVDASFHILDSVTLYDMEQRRGLQGSDQIAAFLCSQGIGL
jgi:Replication initiator protein A